jgi:hypothetical protein
MDERPEVKRLLDELGPDYVFTRSDLDMVLALVPAGVSHSTSYQAGEKWLDIKIGDTPVRTVRELRDVLASTPGDDLADDNSDGADDPYAKLVQKIIDPLRDEITRLRARMRVVLDALAERELLSPSSFVARYSETLDRDGEMIYRGIYPIDDPIARAQFEAEFKAWEATDRERIRAIVGDEEIARLDAAREAFRARYAPPATTEGDDGSGAQQQ